MRDIIHNFINQFNGNWVQIYDAISNKEKGLIDLNEKQLSLLVSNSIFISDNDYFNKFKSMYMPPFAIYYKGNVNLLNKKIFGVLGTVEQTDITELEKFRDDNYIICIKKDNIKPEVINEMLNKQFKLIIIAEENLFNKELNVNDNIVYISEYCTDKISIDPQQNNERLIYALSNVVFIKSKTKENLKVVFENFENEKKNCYIICEQEYNDFVTRLIEQKILIVINDLNQIIELKN